MALKMLTMSLALILVTLPGVYPQRPREIQTMAGELVVLQFPRPRGFKGDEFKLVWTGHTAQGSHVISDLSPAELLQRNMLLDGRSLVILRASVNHQGNYSCTMRNTSFQSWFQLTVHAVKSKEYEMRTTYPKTCDSEQSCRLHCPDVNVPPAITRDGLTWLKDGERVNDYFPSVEEKDSGNYTCTRSFLYLSQTYNATFTVGLKVTPKKPRKTSYITSPPDAAVFNVTMGEQTVIECKAELYSDLDRVCWYSGESLVDKDTSSRVFYNITKEKHGDETKVTYSLVFKKVLEEDLRKNYTCKLVSVSQPATSVSVTLRPHKYTEGHRVTTRSYSPRIRWLRIKNIFHLSIVFPDRAVFRYSKL